MYSLFYNLSLRMGINVLILTLIGYDTFGTVIPNLDKERHNKKH